MLCFLPTVTGATPQTEQFKRAVNARMRAFEIGSVKDVSKLVLQANSP
ncbi:hypothetical protein P4U03_27725 [Bacillus mycoides]|nr:MULTISPECIES: hypothetical protein [Bacillus]ETT83290.1 hypothetical protein C174_03658 [Bacillus mycoides FSL H7-687]MBJ8015952.1 hypothetical protein [Bacillus cereus group sp. N34]MBK5505775.1 hypothetical protein [Bacillus sp. TH12]MCQ6533807.1 hypothetical protein [Bacillus mycoides]MED1040481.1 hypothetical protein [Bacillus mycoides]